MHATHTHTKKPTHTHTHTHKQSKNPGALKPKGGVRAKEGGGTSGAPLAFTLI